MSQSTSQRARSCPGNLCLKEQEELVEPFVRKTEVSRRRVEEHQDAVAAIRMNEPMVNGVDQMRRPNDLDGFILCPVQPRANTPVTIRPLSQAPSGHARSTSLNGNRPHVDVDSPHASENGVVVSLRPLRWVCRVDFGQMSLTRQSGLLTSCRPMQRPSPARLLAARSSASAASRPQTSSAGRFRSFLR